MATPHLTVTATDEHGNSLVPAGSGGVTNKPLSVLPVAFPQHGSANAAVTSVLAAPGAGLNNVVDGVVWSYSAAPTGGSIAISVAGQVIFSVDIALDGPGGIPFPRPFHAPENAELTVTLAAGGVGVTGWVAFVNARTESALAVFTPTQVAGYVDSPYNIALLRAQGKLWQDTAMTVPAIADGDPVRRIVCGTNYYDAPSDAARPLLWDEGNGRWSISFDGVDDVVRCNAQLLSSGSARFAALAAVATARVGVMVNLGGSSSNGLALYWLTPTQLALSEVGVNGSTPVTPTTPSAWHRYAFSRSAVGSSAAAIYQDNTLIQGADYSTGTLAAGGIELAHLISYPTEPYCAVRVAGLVALAGLPSVGERFNIDAYLADLQPPQLPLPERLTGYVDSPYNITLLRRHSKLYQNTSKTLQAVADGDPVRVISCGATDYVAPSDAARPLLYSEGSGKWSLSFDGVDDVVRLPTAVTGTMVEITSRGGYFETCQFSSNYTYKTPFRLQGLALFSPELSDYDASSVVTYGAVPDTFGDVTIFNSTWESRNHMRSFPLLDVSGGVTFSNTWRDCVFTQFPALDVSSGTNFTATWRNCSGLTSFPALDVSKGTNFSSAWQNCSSLTSFPALDTSNGTNFYGAWQFCSSLTSFPALDTSNGTNFYGAWRNCSGLTSFPALDTSNGTNFYGAWQGCSGLTSFPLLDTSSGTDFSYAWDVCNSLTSFPAIDTSNGTRFDYTWSDCGGLTSFPALDVSKGTNFSSAWQNCYSLTSFPANMFDNCQATIYTGAWQGCALNATSVDNILVSIATAAATFSLTNGTLDLIGGTNAAPTFAGLVAKAQLEAAGWTVATTAPFPESLTGYADSPHNIALLRAQGKLWQNTAMTVPATADGDPVRRIDCGGTYYDAPSDAARPLLWDEGSGKWSLSFDGVDDTLATSATYAGPSTFSQFGSLKRVGAAAGKYCYGAYPGDASAYDFLSYVSSGGGTFLYVVNASGVLQYTGATPSLDTAWHRLGGTYDGATITDYLDGSAIGTPTAQTGNVRQSYTLRLGCGANAGFPGRIAGVVFVASALGTIDRAALDAYLAALAP